MSTSAFSLLFIVVLLAGSAWAMLLVARGPGGSRRGPLLLLRLLATTVLATMLMQPQCHRTTTVAEKPVIAVLIDDSQSMNDGPKDARRADIARRWLASPAFRKAESLCDLRYFAFDSRLRDVAPDQLAFSGSESRLDAALREWSSRWQDEANAGIVVLTDGLDTGGAESITPPGLPVSVLEVETPGSVQQARIQLWQVEPPRHAQAGAESTVRVVVQAHGIGDREVPVEWWTDNRKVGERRLRFSKDGEVVESLLAMPPMPPGTYPFEIRIPDANASPEAAKQPFVLVVRQEGRSVLLLQNALGFEGKFLRRALGSDRNLQVDSFTRFKDGGWAKLAGSGADEDKVARLDLSAGGLANRAAVILADVEPSALTQAQWQALADFAARGGGLVMLGGKGFLGSAAAATPLSGILPVQAPAPAREGKFAVRMTEAGSRHPVFGPMFATVGAFPALQSANLASGVAPAARVLMETTVDGQTYPLVVAKQHGDGRVVVVLTDTLWRWRVAAAGWSGRQSPYDTFWTQLIEWLSPDAAGYQSRGRLEISTDRGFYRQGDKVEIRAEWLGRAAPPFAALSATITPPDGQARPLAMHPAVWDNPEGGRVNGFRGTWPAEHTGLHAVESSASTDAGEAKAGVRFAVATALGERRGEPADAQRLRQLAESSGGKVYRLEQAGDWLQSLPAARRHIDRASVVDVWNHPLLATLLLAALGTEWWLRRRSRLP